MRRYQPLCLLAACVLALSSPAYCDTKEKSDTGGAPPKNAKEADPKKMAEWRATAELDHLTAILDLTDKQQAELKPIMITHYKAMYDLMRKYREKISKVLTKEQQKKMQKMRFRRGPGKGPGGPPRKPPAH